jgi:hypothetical protein
MENWGKRAAILIAFSLVLGAILVLAKGIVRSDRISLPDPKPEKLEIKAEPPSDTPEKQPPQANATPPAPAARVAPTAPRASTVPKTPPDPGPGRREIPANLSDRLRTEATGEFARRALFSSPTLEKDGAVDRGKIEKAVRDYIAQYRQQLDLSDSDQERLVDLVMDFREANLRVRSAQRSQSNTPELKLDIKKMQTAMDEFKKMTDVPSENIFGADTPTTLFGDETTKPEEDPFEKFRID